MHKLRVGRMALPILALALPAPLWSQATTKTVTCTYGSGLWDVRGEMRPEGALLRHPSRSTSQGEGTGQGWSLADAGSDASHVGPSAGEVPYGGMPTRLAVIGPLMLALVVGCSGNEPTPTAPDTSTPPQFNHVVIVMEENTDYKDVIGSSSMPYLNGLAQQYGLATQYDADTHPSIGNYFMLVVGDIITNDDSYSTIVTEDNIVRELLAAGKKWKSYAEGLPSAGYTGGNVGEYARKHNVFALLSDVVNDTAEVKNLVPFSQFATDLATDALPNYSFVVPNVCDDAHSCPLSTADNWLRTNVDPLIKSPTFQQNGLLIITFDESGTDDTNGGGRVVWVAVSARSKRGYQSTTRYQHESTLRLSAEALGLKVLPNHAGTAPGMSEFFIR
jgi:phosphatidylinositol-3-phosphatase